MTGIAAAVRLGPRGPSDDVLGELTARMLAAFVRRRDDGVEVWAGASAALGQVWYATTPEDAARGPSVARCGALRAVGDVRVDNREDVLAALSLPTSTADLDLLLAAWEKWGEDTILRAIGDYAVAIWDVERRRLTLARDAMGGRGLYLTRANGMVLISSEMHAFGVEPSVAFELEPLQAARYLVGRYEDARGTIFAGFEAVPAGGVLHLAHDRQTRKRIWSPDPFASASGSTEEHAERFRAVLGEAVHARMRAVGTVAVTVSGGIDSSSVACLAAEKACVSGLPTFLHFAFPGLQTDESEAFESIVRHTRCTAISVDPRDHAAETSLDAGRARPGELHSVLMSNYGVLIKALPDSERAVLLTGIGGDDLLGPTSQDFPDFLKKGRFVEAWRTARKMSGRGSNLVPFALRELARMATPRRVRAAFRRWRPTSALWPPWLSPSVAQALDGWHRQDIEAYLKFPAPNEVQRGLAWGIARKWGIQATDPFFDAFCRSYGVDVRTPFHDRRVVELLLAMPSTERFDGTITKGVLRRGMTGIVPSLNRTRSVVADFTPVVQQAFYRTHRQEYLRLAADSELERAEIVVPGTLVTKLDPAAGLSPIYEMIAIENAVRTIREAAATKDRVGAHRVVDACRADAPRAG